MDQLVAFLIIAAIIILVGFPTVSIIRDDVGDSTKSFLDFSNQAKKRVSQQLAYTYIGSLDCTTSDLEVRLVNNGLTDITFFALLLNGLPIPDANIEIYQVIVGHNVTSISLFNITDPIEIDDRIILNINNMNATAGHFGPNWNDDIIIDEYGTTSELQIVSNAGKLITLSIPMPGVVTC